MSQNMPFDLAKSQIGGVAKQEAFHSSLHTRMHVSYMCVRKVCGTFLVRLSLAQLPVRGRHKLTRVFIEHSRSDSYCYRGVRGLTIEHQQQLHAHRTDGTRTGAVQCGRAILFLFSILCFPTFAPAWLFFPAKLSTALRRLGTFLHQLCMYRYTPHHHNKRRQPSPYVLSHKKELKSFPCLLLVQSVLMILRQNLPELSL